MSVTRTSSARTTGRSPCSTLNRPDRRNALSRALVAALGDAPRPAWPPTPGVRAVVLTGAGPAFCSGMDLKEAEATAATAEAETAAVADVQALADLIQQVHALAKPTIAALNGDAFAGGARAGVACDFVVAAERPGSATPRSSAGLVAAIVMHDLVRQVGDRRARELLLTRRADRRGRGRALGPGQPGRRPRALPATRRSPWPGRCCACGPEGARDDQAPARRGQPPPRRPPRRRRRHAPRSGSPTRRSKGCAPSSRSGPRGGPRGGRDRTAERSIGQEVVVRCPERADATSDPLGRRPDRRATSCGRRPARFPDRDAVVFPRLGLRWSWAELDRRVDAVGVGPDRAAGSGRASTSASGR